ncbi:LysR family transcriptional regulator [Paenibacillus zanthoxyli]|uniref:LysR family transcriptional regulator n=1 Tax=Paenibacillus zanthoxyli TaxID=369399 RepID=UPI000471F6F6|nr:LysR family transcriptional regulator [Paenibacillus zanthoxyli]
MDLLQLKYFQMVAKHEHMTHAADELHIAQPTLSKVIARLEADLGVCLFDRQGRQIKLNKFGRVFLHRVEKIFLEIEDGKRELSDMIGHENLEISIASNCFSLFPALLQDFFKLYPHISFRQATGSTMEMQQQLQNGDAHFSISSPPIEGEHIECIPLVTEEIFLMVSQRHKFASFKSINLIEAANEPFISLKEGLGKWNLTKKLCNQAGFTPNIIFESCMIADLLDMVNYDLGVTLLPIPQWNHWSQLLITKPVPLHIKEPVCNRTTALSFVKGRYLPQVVKQFKNYIINYFGA